MARVGRLAGALLVQTAEHGEPAWFLVGDTKVPCDWVAAGFERPAERDAARVPWIRLAVTGAPALGSRVLQLPCEGEAAAQLVAERLLIARNGAVSERLLRLVFGEGIEGAEDHDGSWLVALPTRIWDVVRDAVLKCS